MQLSGSKRVLLIPPMDSSVLQEGLGKTVELRKKYLDSESDNELPLVRNYPTLNDGELKELLSL